MHLLNIKDKANLKVLSYLRILKTIYGIPLH